MKQYLGVQGAKQQSWVPDNPRTLLKRISDDNLGATEAALRALHLEAILKDPLTYVAGLQEDCWNNYYRAMTRKPPIKEPHGPSQAERISAMRGRLMFIILSNGKMLKDCTFGELAKEGGWLIALSKMGKRDEIVGQKLSLEQIAAAWPEPATQ